MTRPIAILAMLAWFAPGPYQAAIPYFTHVRDVKQSTSQNENYIVVDRELWDIARPDLADLRLYDGDTQVPFAFKEKRGGNATEEKTAPLLNLGKVGDATQFDIDMSALPEYDRVRLQLTAQNFVATARIDGKSSLNDRHAVRLASVTIYDFSSENLGSNSLLKFPTSTWPYLHIEIDSTVTPDQIKSALASNLREEKASWTDAGPCQPVPSAARNQTTLTCQTAAAMPVDRITFQIAPESVNFRRTVTIDDASGNQIARSAISRVRITRNRQTAVSEELSVDLPGVRSPQLKLTIENADNAPLAIQGTQALSIERRLYFDTQGRNSVKLYFGDPNLTAPSYDYVTFFREDPNAARAEFGPSQANPTYTSRPDDRPWSEKHKAILWAAMLLAIATLALLALRGLASPQTANRPSD